MSRAIDQVTAHRRLLDAVFGDRSARPNTSLSIACAVEFRDDVLRQRQEREDERSLALDEDAASNVTLGQVFAFIQADDPFEFFCMIVDRKSNDAMDALYLAYDTLVANARAALVEAEEVEAGQQADFRREEQFENMGREFA